MNPFRIFKRLRDIEHEASLTFQAISEIVHMVDEDRAALRPMLHAINRRLNALESRVICARCGGQFDNTKREHGPMLMERGEGAERSYIVACYDCEPYAKRNGWRRKTNPIGRQEASA